MTPLEELNALLAQGDRAAEQGRHSEALRCYELAHPRAPRSVAVLARLAQAHFELGNHERASAHFLAAANLRPGEARHWHNAGIALNLSGRLADAEQAWRRAIAADAGYGRSWFELARRLEQDARLWEAEACYLRALGLMPDSAASLLGLAGTKLHQGDPAAALRWTRRALARAADDCAELFSSYLLTAHYHPRMTARRLAALARRAPRYWPVPAASRAPDDIRKPPGARLAVGYLSPRLGDGPPGRMLLALLAGHDRSRVESYCYSTWRHDSAVTARLRAAAERWRDVEALDDEALAQRVRDDRIDVLVDLAGHSPSGRVGVLCRRPAPVQLSWLDYFDSMGLACSSSPTRTARRPAARRCTPNRCCVCRAAGSCSRHRTIARRRVPYPCRVTAT